MYIKDYQSWSFVKSKLDKKDKSIFIRSGEIRWVSLGVNVGNEIDGKGNDFARPCLILHVIGNRLCLVVPVTSKIKNRSGYMEIDRNGKSETVCLDQIRVVSPKRVLSRIGKLSTDKTSKVKEEIKKVFDF